MKSLDYVFARQILRTSTQPIITSDARLTTEDSDDMRWSAYGRTALYVRFIRSPQGKDSSRVMCYHFAVKKRRVVSRVPYNLIF